jgi:hypothetical protein
VVAEARKGFARRGLRILATREFARIPNIDAEGLRMETEITRDRYLFWATHSLAASRLLILVLEIAPTTSGFIDSLRSP